MLEKKDPSQQSRAYELAAEMLRLRGADAGELAERVGRLEIELPSWGMGRGGTRFGALPGYIAGNFGSFGGRWISADRLDPSRLCMYVPAGRYKALHMIAVAEDRPDSVPIVSAQFYRPDAGHPFNFSATVPTGKSGPADARALPIKLADGTEVPIRGALGRFTAPISFIGLPALSIPVREAGPLPIGVQLIARPHEDAVLLRAAHYLEKAGIVGHG